MSEGKLILLYDGACGLCEAAMRFVARRDGQQRFRFVPQHSDEGRALLSRHGLSGDPLRTMVLIEGDCASTRSTAVLRIARRLGGVWRLGYGLILVPRFLRDWLYDRIAHNRHRFRSVSACGRGSARGATTANRE